MEVKLQHIFHEHPLLLIADGSTNQSNVSLNCEGCLKPILGPMYTCEECQYFLHKVCADLPHVIDHPMHPQHPCTLLAKPPVINDTYFYICNLCHTMCEGFVYHCSSHDFCFHIICGAASLPIKDKCHMHPLIPIQTPSSFSCHICHKKDESVSYKCSMCPFWVHQGCTLLPNIVRHSAHDHHLTLLPSMLSEHHWYSLNCDICHDKLFSSYGSYSCVACLFFAHISCGKSETIISSSRSRNQGIEVNQDSSQRLHLLPMQQNSTELMSHFVDNYIGQDANMGNKITYLRKKLSKMIAWFYRNSNTIIGNKINHFAHKHPLFLIDEQMNEKTCDACAILISTPSYGCIKCDYILHKCCTEFPKYILHALHPEHQLTLEETSSYFTCSFCYQMSNGFYYRCSSGENFRIDIKCASLLGHVYHKAHKHLIGPKFISFNTCSACGLQSSGCFLQCETCSFSLCFVCALAPPIVKHRYGKSYPFVLTYYPPENHYNDYICEICEGVLNPKEWFYHCVYADQFCHIICMIESGASSNIKYGKSYKFSCHEHKLTLTSCTYEVSRCNYCREPLRTGSCVGFECKSCNFSIHIQCVEPMTEEQESDTDLFNEMIEMLEMLEI